MTSFSSTPRTRVKRLPERGSYEVELVHGILDEGLICHVGFSTDGAPVVIPTIHARVDDVLYFHGSPASRMLRSMKDGVEVCVTVTLLDGLVLARSAFHHSMNYRSAVVMGVARPVTDAAEKLEALRAIVEHVSPGRWDSVRGPSDDEFRKTLVLALPIEEASAKVRSGPVGDDPEDLELPIWAGILPLSTTTGTPQPDAALDPALDVPPHVTAWKSPAERLRLKA